MIASHFIVISGMPLILLLLIPIVDLKEDNWIIPSVDTELEQSVSHVGDHIIRSKSI